MRDCSPVNFGEGGGAVEVDETFIGTLKAKPKNHRGYAQRNKVLSLVDRNTSKAKSVVVDDLKVSTLSSCPSSRRISQMRRT
ncbi:MAG: hypothetical protein OXK72_01700, partial [Gammaproteobacteria bacterium]|nr:hypothetical protein [Gammaproteobacteria bacterium]